MQGRKHTILFYPPTSGYFRLIKIIISTYLYPHLIIFFMHVKSADIF